MMVITQLKIDSKLNTTFNNVSISMFVLAFFIACFWVFNSVFKFILGVMVMVIFMMVVAVAVAGMNVHLMVMMIM